MTQAFRCCSIGAGASGSFHDAPVLPRPETHVPLKSLEGRCPRGASRGGSRRPGGGGAYCSASPLRLRRARIASVVSSSASWTSKLAVSGLSP